MGVPAVVKPDARQPCHLDHLVEVVRQALRVGRSWVDSVCRRRLRNERWSLARQLDRWRTVGVTPSGARPSHPRGLRPGAMGRRETPQQHDRVSRLPASTALPDPSAEGATRRRTTWGRGGSRVALTAVGRRGRLSLAWSSSPSCWPCGPFFTVDGSLRGCAPGTGVEADASRRAGFRECFGRGRRHWRRGVATASRRRVR
jgi:hypothetical protein